MASGVVVTSRGGVVMHDDVVHVRKSPLGVREIDRKELLFAADSEPHAETADLEECLAPHDDSAREEPEYRSTRVVRLPVPNRALSHQQARWVDAVIRADEDARRDQAEAAMRFEKFRRTGQSARFPPGIIVGKGDVRSLGEFGAYVSSSGAEVTACFDQHHGRVPSTDRLARPVARVVVDDDYRRPLGKLVQPVKREESAFAAIPRNHHDGDVRSGLPKQVGK